MPSRCRVSRPSSARMTPDERRKQHILNGSLPKRVAKGSGTTVEDVNRQLKQFVQMQKMLKQLGSMAGLSGGGGKNARRRAMQMLRGRGLPRGLGVAQRNLANGNEPRALLQE